jgi:hypothetical protein
MAGVGVVSFKVLVVPEDPTHNGYILKPLVEALLADSGKPLARVTVLTRPRLTGYDHARRALLDELPAAYRHFDLWLFFPDADRASAAAMSALERQLRDRGVTLFCCPAVPEVEIYACAGLRAELGNWEAARSSKRFKEAFFDPLLARHGDARRAGQGRDQLIARSLQNLPLLMTLCPELRTLRDRIAALGAGAAS